MTERVDGIRANGGGTKGVGAERIVGEGVSVARIHCRKRVVNKSLAVEEKVKRLLASGFVSADGE